MNKKKIIIIVVAVLLVAAAAVGIVLFGGGKDKSDNNSKKPSSSSSNGNSSYVTGNADADVDDENIEGSDQSAEGDVEGDNTDDTSISGETDVTDETENDAEADKDHVYGDWTVTTEATCVAGGTEKRVCADCGKEEERSVPAKGHTEEILYGYPATCTENGVTDGKRCSVCYATIEYQQTINMTGHTTVTVSGTPATCTATGLTEGSKCSVCGTILKNQTTIAKLPHNEVEIPAVAATCSSTGFSSGRKCSVCQTVTESPYETSMLSHSFGSWTTGKAATCGADGYNKRNCTMCGYEETTTVSATGDHNYNANGCTSCGAALEATSNLSFKLSNDGTYYICTGLSSYTVPDIIVIPAYYNGKPVKEINCGSSSWAFMDTRGQVEEIIIAEGIEKIGRSAFYCAGITSITLPSSVNYIDNSAFTWCDMLEAIYISTSGWSGCFTYSSTTIDVDFSDPFTVANILRRRGYYNGYYCDYFKR